MGPKKKNKASKQKPANKKNRNVTPPKRKEKETKEDKKETKREKKAKKKNIEAAFRAEMDKLGYYIKSMKGDGNCLFRSFADQYENNQNHYETYRKQVIDYMEKHIEEFKPFIEDDQTFDDYIHDMSQDGEWGGNLEIHALSMLFNVNFYIHIHEHPMYIVNNHTNPVKNIMLTYQEGKHYNSLRKKEDKANDSGTDDEIDDVAELIGKVDHLII